MGSVIPLKKSANSAYLDLKNLVNDRLIEVERLIEVKLDSKVGLIKKMSEYHLRSGGKRLRALLTLGSAKLAGYDQKGTRDVNLSACVELIHSATLLHDDVIDESDLRRGIKTSNALWGNQSSILVGDYLLSRCFEIMVDDGDLEILKLLSSTSSKIAQGEVKQLEHKGEADLLEETYIDIINLKTAALFSAATKTGACLAGSNEKEKSALESYGKNIGLAFQIADDALDYYSKEIIFGKKIGKDFYEGKVTLPLIIIFQRADGEERNFLINTFKKYKRTEEDFKKTLDLIKKYKAVEDSLQRAQYFVNVSHDALGIFEDCNEKKILQNLTGFSLNRSF
jgi:octaprenyl-diphosphate synthase